jgi:ribonuclease HI
MCNETDKTSMEIITSTIYGIWYARNMLIFQDKDLAPQDISSNSVKQLQEYQRLGLNNRPSICTQPTGNSNNDNRWSPPPRGASKINVDAHWSGDGRWFSGLILRREDGSTVGVATRWHTGTNDSELGEALAVNDALDLVEKLGETAVIIESDCKTVIKAIEKKINVRKRWGDIVRRCVSFQKSNPRSRFSWVKRDCNQVAHVLARWAENEPNIDWSTSVPYCIRPYIQKDMGFVFVSYCSIYWFFIKKKNHYF